MTLGELIDALEPFPDHGDIMFDFGYFYPDSLHSWRGDYAQLSIDFKEDHNYPTVGAFKKRLQEAVGQTFFGWKGGEYVMTRDTPLWVARRGTVGHTIITGVLREYEDVILLTGHQNA